MEQDEKRAEVRLHARRPVRIEDVRAGVDLSAELVNYSSKGLYFEADKLLQIQDEIFIGIDNSPLAPEPDEFECYRAKVLWRKDLKDSLYQYGYGIKFLSGNEVEDSEQNKSPKNSRKDLRRHPRKIYKKRINFATRGQVYEGIIKDISPSGAFIKSGAMFPAKQRITLALPLKNGRDKKIDGLIVWKNNEGFAVRFLSRGNR